MKKGGKKIWLPVPIYQSGVERSTRAVSKRKPKLLHSDRLRKKAPKKHKNQQQKEKIKVIKKYSSRPNKGTKQSEINQINTTYKLLTFLRQIGQFG